MINNTIVDVISNSKKNIWEYDIDVFLDLNINVLRIYETDFNSKNEFMSTLEKHNIYVIFDLPGKDFGINRDNPLYDVSYLDHLKEKVKTLSFKNTLGFFVGNEVATKSGKQTLADTFIKAAIRDLKKWMKREKINYIPLGYAAIDNDNIRIPEARFFASGDEEERADFYGINIYSWCGDSDAVKSSYLQRKDDFKRFPIPVIFSEYGCNTIKPRTFSDAKSLFGDLDDVFSGGILYQYSEEINNYGIIRKTPVGIEKIEPEYSTFKRIMHEIPRKLLKIYNTNVFIPCENPQNPDYLANCRLPPTPSETYCSCIWSSMHCIVESHTSDLEEFSDLCRKSDCSELMPIKANGLYGSFSQCNLTIKLSYLYNMKYEKNGNCDGIYREKVSLADCGLSLTDDSSISGAWSFRKKY